MWERSANKKILFVHDRFGAFAGAESNILATATELNQRGYSLAILHGPATGQAEETWNQTFTLRFPLSVPTATQSVVTACEVFRPDLIYVHNLAALDALTALITAQIPIVRMVHDHDLYCLRSYKYNYFTRQICDRPLSPYCLIPCGAFVTRDSQGPFPIKWASYPDKRRELELNRQFDRLLVATKFMKDELLRNGFAAEKIEIHPPVPRDNTLPERSNFSDRNLIIYSGQITRGKGVDVLLRALACVAEPFECLIFGDGNYRPHCEKLSRTLGLADHVHFQGYVAPAEIARHYRECSVVAMSSVWPEPFGAAGLEGLRYGVPVVAFDAGGIKEWLINGVNGFLVPWMDHEFYAERVSQLLRHKTIARQMGERGRSTVAATFSFSKYLDGLENLFTRVVAPSGPMASF
jgi:glycosyltransferase involved in cell wall biosynthesis